MLTSVSCRTNWGPTDIFWNNEDVMGRIRKLVKFLQAGKIISKWSDFGLAGNGIFFKFAVFSLTGIHWKHGLFIHRLFIFKYLTISLVHISCFHSSRRGEIPGVAPRLISKLFKIRVCFFFLTFSPGLHFFKLKFYDSIYVYNFLTWPSKIENVSLKRSIAAENATPSQFISKAQD